MNVNNDGNGLKITIFNEYSFVVSLIQTHKRSSVNIKFDDGYFFEIILLNNSAMISLILKQIRRTASFIYLD
jgi:hypothetical protein